MMINYLLAEQIVNGIAYGLFILMVVMSFYYIASFFISGKKVKPVPHSNKKTKFAVIVPARNESKVIMNTFSSFITQTYDRKYYDVWVIVESEKDPTCKLTKKFGYQIFVRKDLHNKHTKGYAIQELYNYFREIDLKYDAYMIIDAGDILSAPYIETMNDLRQSGVQVGLGYRNYTNASQNWMTSTSAVFFSYMMSFTARMRTNLFQKTTLAGTGLFVDAQIVEDAGGWIWTGMTEDTQLTAWCYYHDVKMRYYPLVEFFDEQCSTLKASHKQKIRWIWGYFESRKFLKEPRNVDYHTLSKGRRFWAHFEYRVPIFPFAIFSVVNFLLFFISLALTIASTIENAGYTAEFWSTTVSQFAILWGTYILIALLVIIKDNRHLKFKFPRIIVTLLTYILFFVDIIFAFLDGLFHKKKRKTWDAIDHTGEVNNPLINDGQKK